MASANDASAHSRMQRSGLAQRWLTALVLVPLVALLVGWSYWSVAVLIVAAIIVGLRELYAIFAQGQYHTHAPTGLIVALLIALAVAMRRELFPYDPLPLAFTMALIGSLLMALARYGRSVNVLTEWAFTFGGAVYISWLFSHFILLRDLNTPPLQGGLLGFLRLDAGAAWVVAVLVVTWIQDAAAYFAGRRFGRHKMAPLLSPKKTWEGAAGGFIVAILAGVGCVPLLGLPVSLAAGAFIGFVGGVLGPLGDLSESMIKRQLGVKDTGQIIPGHGGLLDRVDSILFTGPVLYYLIRLITGA